MSHIVDMVYPRKVRRYFSFVWFYRVIPTVLEPVERTTARSRFHERHQEFADATYVPQGYVSDL